jgi:cell division protein FtsB
MSHAIKSQESDLADLSSRVDSLKSQLQKTQRQYPNGAPQAVIDKYDADRTRLNRMIAQYNSGFDDYTTALSEYNRRVAAYNAKYAR